MAKKRFSALSDALTEYVGNTAAAALVGAAMALITAGVLALVARDLRGAALGLLILGLVLLLTAFVSGYSSIRAAIMTRRGFYGLNATAMTLLFLAIAAVIIWVGAQGTAKWDVTATRQFSIAPQTESILKDLQQEVRALAFFVPGDINQTVVRSTSLDLLEEYGRQSGLFSFEVVDPDLNPERARNVGINPNSQPGTVVFSSEGALQPVNTLIFQQEGGFLPNLTMEKDFSQAVLAVTRTQQKVVYFTIRHGERNITSADDGGYALARFGIEGDNYTVRPLDIVTAGTIPEDAAAVIVAGPQRELLEEEAGPLGDYLRGGGNALFLLDPNPPASFTTILEEWGVRLGEGTIIDLASSVSNNTRAPFVGEGGYSLHAALNGPGDELFNAVRYSPITQPIDDFSFYDHAAAIIPLAEQADDLELPNIFYAGNTTTIAPFLTSSPIFSWLERDADAETRDDDEATGPLAIGVTIDAAGPYGVEPTPGAPRTKIVVIGDSDFASNRFFSSFSNGDVLLNSVNWLTGDVDLISVRPKLRDARLLIVKQEEWNFIRWSSLLILPIAVGLAGAFVWWKQR